MNLTHFHALFTNTDRWKIEHLDFYFHNIFRIKLKKRIFLLSQFFNKKKAAISSNSIKTHPHIEYENANRCNFFLFCFQTYYLNAILTPFSIVHGIDIIKKIRKFYLPSLYLLVGNQQAVACQEM